jgi:hypothetical protein
MTIYLTRILGILEWLVGIGAVWGGFALAVWPDGHLLQMPVAFLQGTPFSDFRIPGLVLCVVVGGSNLIGGSLAMLRRKSARLMSVLAGGILTGWIAAQILLIGYRHPIQWVYLAVGVLILALALCVPGNHKTRIVA